MRNLLRLLRLAIPLWRWVLLGLLLSLATTLAHIGLLALSSWFITSMAMAGSVGAVMNYFTPSAGVRALAIARAGGRYAERFVNHDTTFRMLAALRVWFFRRVEPLAPAGLTLRRSGDLLSRIRADIDLLDDFYVRGVVPLSVAALSAACLVPFLLHFDATLAWMDLGGLACAGVLFPLLLGTLAREPGRQRVAEAAELRSCMVEQIQGMAELEALGATGFQEARVDGAARRMEKGQRRINSLQGMAEAQITSIGSLATWAAMFVLAPLVADGRLSGPEMAMLAVVVLASFETVMPLPGVLQRFGEMTAAAARLFEIIDEKPRVTEPAFPPGGQTGTPRTLDVSVRDLWFRYSPELPWIHRGLSFEMPAGRRLGVAGPTGAGKSTLVSILLRFWEYEEGSITIRAHGSAWSGARELRSLCSEEARRLFSVAPQSPHLFHSSVRENLLIAKEGAKDDELWSVLESAILADLVVSLPDGLDTIVGEAGREMSVGEAQRLSVARALLKESPVCIFDEPTEGLDDPTAERLLASVDRRLRGKSVLIISHRYRDFLTADPILRVDLPVHHPEAQF